MGFTGEDEVEIGSEEATESAPCEDGENDSEDEAGAEVDGAGLVGFKA